MRAGPVAVTLACSLLLGTGCATAPTHFYDLYDATDDEAVEDAVEEAAGQLEGRGHHVAARQAAARALGRLRSDDPRAVTALKAGLHPREAPALRQQSAWALGELRSPAALPILTDALRTKLDDRTGAYVLEAIAKHYAVMARDEDTLVAVVEAMVFFAGNRPGAVPPVYGLLGRRTRTVGVNVRVLGNAVEGARRSASAAPKAAMYNAALELLQSLQGRTDEIRAGPEAWAARVDAAVEMARTALDSGHEDTALLVLWYLGQLSRDRELARPAARVLAGADLDEARRPTRLERPAARMIAVWALARMHVHALGPRRALLLDVLSRDMEPEVLRLLGDLSTRPTELDALQRVLGLVAGGDS